MEDRRATRRKRQPLVTNNWWEPQTASKNFVHVHSKEQFDAVLATANGNPHTPIPVVGALSLPLLPKRRSPLAALSHADCAAGLGSQWTSSRRGATRAAGSSPSG